MYFFPSFLRIDLRNLVALSLFLDNKVSAKEREIKV